MSIQFYQKKDIPNYEAVKSDTCLPLMFLDYFGYGRYFSQCWNIKSIHNYSDGSTWRSILKDQGLVYRNC